MLAQPDLAQVPTLTDQNRVLVSSWDCVIGGRHIAELRREIRQELLPELGGHAGPVVASGHQPELFHPGVWLKNFVSHHIARKCRGTALHLIVDNDTAKRAFVRVPTAERDGLGVIQVPLDRWQGEVPYEEYEVRDSAVFRQFASQLSALLQPLGFRPLAADLWGRCAEQFGSLPKLADRISLLRHTQELEWGCESSDIKCSRIWQTRGFHRLVCHMAAHAAVLRNVYNQCQQEFRRRHRIRSLLHPVPPLQQSADWSELPLWVWDQEHPTRTPVYARPCGGGIQLSNLRDWTADIAGGPTQWDRRVDELQGQLGAEGRKIRPRALTTTMFLRMFLTDLFVHGLGGARYDELSDAIMRRFFGIDPPAFLMVTGTLHLPLAADRDAPERLRALSRRIREIKFNPQRCIANPEGDAAEWVAQRWELAGMNPSTRKERRQRFEAIRQLNDRLAKTLNHQAEELRSRRADLQERLHSLGIATERDWAYCLYPADQLKSFYAPFLES